MSELSNTLNEHIYPHIDAYDLGFLKSLTPKKVKGEVFCACPHCSNEAHYVKNQPYIKCRKGCKRSSTIWDALSKAGLNNKEIWKELTTAANYPNNKNKPATDTPFQIIKNVMQDSLLNSPKALSYIKELGWDKELITKSHLGYIPSLSLIREKLNKAGINDETINTLSILDDPNLERCIILPWRHPNGKIKFVGMNRTSKKAEFITQKNFNKNLPKGFSSKEKSTFILSNPFYSALLNAKGVASFSILGGALSKEQATYLAQRNTKYHIVIENEKAEGKHTEATCVLLSSVGCEALVSVINEPVINLSKNTLNNLEQNAQNIASYLSRRILTTKHSDIARHQILRNINLNDKKALIENLNMQQTTIKPDTAEHLRLIANLIDIGATEQQIRQSMEKHLSPTDISALQKFIATTKTL